MRPLRLRISGFTCFRNEQDIDFTGLELFAIAGPTGAGKTSILDAIVFALYGEVPRMGAQRLAELISVGLDRASAMLDFAIGATVYRIARRIRRRGAAQTQIERLDGEIATPITEGVRGVDQVVTQLLGIDASTFLQAVVLPQGRFADFLKSRAGERRSMLRSLLQLDVYERMRERATQLGRSAALQAESLHARLDDDFVDATPARLAALDVRLGALVTEARIAADAAEGARQRFDALDRMAKLRGELQGARDVLARLEQQRGSIALQDQARQRSERARPLIGVLDRASAARSRYEKALEGASDLSAHVEVSSRRHAEATSAATAARTAALDIAVLTAALARLDQVIPLLGRRAGCEHLAGEADRAYTAAQDDIAVARVAVATCDTEITEYARRSDEFEQRLRDIDHDPEQLRRLTSALGPAAEYVARCRALARTRTQLEQRDAAAAVAGAELQHAREAAFVATRQHADATSGHERAKAACEDARLEHLAHDLRSRTTPGAPCPVCLQRVAIIPAVARPTDLDDAISKELVARREHSRCAEEEHKARTALELADRAASAAAHGRDELAAELSTIAREVDEVGQRLHELVGELVDGDPASPGERIPRVHAEALTRAGRHAELERGKREVDRALDEARHRHAMARQRIEAAERDRERAKQDGHSARSELVTVEARIWSAAPSGDPERERARIGHRIDELATTRDRTELEARSTARLFHELSTELAIAEAARTAAVSDAAEADAGVRDALETSAFRTEGDVRAAVLPLETCEEIDRRVRTWREAHAVATMRVADLEQQAGADDVTAEAVAAARIASDAARARHSELLAEHGRLDRERCDVEQQLAKAAALRRQLAVHKAARATYDQLASDLRTDQLQAYLLEGTFREIVEGASVRLLELSGGRYTLDYANDDFYVVDHDNARERRRADTLSGGETFLAALSLALQLSEQVQRAAGAVRLDSLFIDEGFGTLDADTLATVSDAIQQLSRGHRMVGVITHVQELTAALPARIDVRLGPDGSRIEVVSQA